MGNLKIKTAYAFGHKFEDFDGLIDSLLTLESEEVLYQHMWDEKSQNFKYYKIKLTASEIFQYVEAHIAKGQFDSAIRNGKSFKKALKAIENKEIAFRVESFGNYGTMKMKDGKVEDIRGCFASFLPVDLDRLLLSQSSKRWETVFKTDSINKLDLIYNQLDQFPSIAKFLSDRKHKRQNFEITCEYDVQDLLYCCLKSVFDNIRMEEWTIKHGGSSKRTDIVIPEIDTIIEVKMVRNKAHANTIVDELKIDIESFHVHPNCRNLICFIYDPQCFMFDHKFISSEIAGKRVKNKSEFDVKLFIR